MLGGAVLSVVVHATTITAWVVATLPDTTVARYSIVNHVIYLPPPDRVPQSGTGGDRVRYTRIAEQGLGSGRGGRTSGDAKQVEARRSIGVVAPVIDSVEAAPGPESPGRDTVYSVLEVDTAVVRLAASAAPAYPLKLLEQHVEGFVNAQYTVDTTGFADTTTFKVLTATNPEFVTAVRNVLPHMRFSPAKIGNYKVPQLVQQQFRFRIGTDMPMA